MDYHGNAMDVTQSSMAVWGGASLWDSDASSRHRAGFLSLSSWQQGPGR